jgi:Cysteine rich repeat
VATLAESWLRPWSRPNPKREDHCFWENKVMPRTVHCSALVAIIPAWLLSVAILPSAAQAQDNLRKTRTALACGQELKKQCSGVPVLANNMLECLQKNQEKLSPRCVARANNVVRNCDRDAAQLCQNVVAGQGNILECLTTAKRSVSRRCNAALDAAFLRQ